jgi:Sigma-70, region 4
VSAADGGGGNAARAMHDEVAEAPLDLIAAKDKVTGRVRTHLRVVEPDEDLDAAPALDDDEAEAGQADDRDDEEENPAQGHRRFWPVRARSESVKRLSKREIERGRMLYPEAEMADYYAERPRTRADCLHGPHAERPCPWLSCKRHLFFDVSPSGSVKYNFPPEDDSPEALVRALHAMRDTCALDVADRGGITLEEVGERLQITRERARQIESRGMAKLKLLSDLGKLSDWVDVDRCLSRRYKSPTSEHDGEGDEGPTSHGLTSDATETVERVESGAFDPIDHGVGLSSFLR